MATAACGPGSEAGGTTGTSGEDTSTTSTSSASSATSSATGADDGTTVGPPGVELGVCGRYIACAEELQVTLSPIVGAYGETGSCWGSFSEEICWADCRAAIRELSAANPEVDACLECDGDQDCAFWPETTQCTFDNVCAAVDPCDPWAETLVGCCEADPSTPGCAQILATGGGACPFEVESCSSAAEAVVACMAGLTCAEVLPWHEQCYSSACGGGGGGFVAGTTGGEEGACCPQAGGFIDPPTSGGNEFPCEDATVSYKLCTEPDTG